MNMKNLIKYGFIAVVSCFLISCESIMIPEPPYVVTEMESCEGCGVLFKYKINSIKHPERYTEIVTDQLFMVGDTLQVNKQNCN